MIEYLVIILWNIIVGFIFILNIDKEVRQNWIPFSFFSGTSITLLISFWMSYFGFPFAKISVFLVIIIFALGAVTIYYRKKLFVEYIKGISKGDVIAFILCFFIGILPMMIRTVFNAEFPYCDGFTYISIADYLKESGYRDIVELEEMQYHPWMSQMLIYQINHFRIGGQMLLAFFTSLFGKSFALDVFSPLTGYNVFLCGMAIWNLAKKRFKQDKYCTVISIAIIGGNIPIIYWCAVFGFFPQIMGMAFLLYSITQILDTIDSKSIKQAIIDSFSIAALVLIYNEVLPFFVLSLIGPLFYYLIKAINVKKIIINVLITAINSVLLIIVYFSNMLKAILNMLKASVGWNINKGFFDYIAYYLSTIPADKTFKVLQKSNISIGYVFLTVLITLIVILGIKYIKKIDKEFLNLWILITIPWLLILAYFIFWTSNPFGEGRGNTWSVFKLMQYYFIVGGPIIAYAISAFAHKYIKHTKIIAFFLISIIGFNFYNAYVYSNKLADDMRNYTGNSEKPLEEYYSLYEKYKNEEKPIVLLELPHKHRQMVAYMLKDNKLISDWLTDGYFGLMKVDMEIGEESSIILMYNPQEENAVANLCEQDSGILFGEGFYTLETSEERTWRWGQNTAQLYLYKDHNDQGKFTVDAYGVKDDLNGVLEVCNSEGKVYKEYRLYADHAVSIELEIGTGTSYEEIILKYSGEAVKETEHINARNLAFIFENWKYESTSNQKIGGH